MASSLKEFSTTAGSNTTVGSANIAENCAPSGLNNAIRELIAYVVDWFMNTGTIASATTTDLGTKTQNYLAVSGTTTITAFGTPTNKVEYTLKFDGALTLTHNATSLILPSGASVTTIAGEVAKFRHEGSGNWRCVSCPARWLYGDGTSGQILVSGGSGVLPSWSSQIGGYAAKTSGYTIIATDNSDTIDFTTAGATAALTAAATLGSGFQVTILNTASSGDVTINPDGSETLDGLSTRLLRPGDRVTIVCDGSNWKTKSGVYSFTTAEINLAAAMASTDAHGLGSYPDRIKSVLRCKTAELGYAVGDEVEVAYAFYNGYESNNAQVFANASDLKSIQGATNKWYLAHATTGTVTQVTAARWKLVLKAWRY